jgi:Zn-dependent protease
MTINPSRLTPDAIHCIDVAVTTARERHNPYLDTEHLLVGALHTELVKKILAASGVAADALHHAIIAELSIVRDIPLKTLKGLTSQASQAMDRAGVVAESMGVSYVNSGHIALSILQAPGPFLTDIVQRFPQLDLDQVRQTLTINMTPPTEMFLQRWRPATWENARILAATSGGTITASHPITLTFTTTRQIKKQERQRQRQQSARQDSTVLWIGLGLLAVVIYLAILRPDVLVPVTIVAGGWIVSLVLHEFAHALVAYWGGDHTVVDKGYLTLNPLKYMHPLLSIGLPLLFLAMGGIGLPGGCVYIEVHRLRNKWWGSAVSAAGPFANLICLFIFSIPFWTGYVTPERYAERETLWASMAFLIWLQGMAILFNLIPLPPLDGFGIIEPFLPERFAFQMRSLGSLGLMLIILMFWLPSSDNARFDPRSEIIDQSDNIASIVNITPQQRSAGVRAFLFWRDDD